jgi:hypothetical protein
VPSRHLPSRDQETRHFSECELSPGHSETYTWTSRSQNTKAVIQSIWGRGRRTRFISEVSACDVLARSIAWHETDKLGFTKQSLLATASLEVEAVWVSPSNLAGPYQGQNRKHTCACIPSMHALNASHERVEY